MGVARAALPRSEKQDPGTATPNRVGFFVNSRLRLGPELRPATALTPCRAIRFSANKGRRQILGMLSNRSSLLHRVGAVNVATPTVPAFADFPLAKTLTATFAAIATKPA